MIARDGVAIARDQRRGEVVEYRLGREDLLSVAGPVNAAIGSAMRSDVKQRPALNAAYREAAKGGGRVRLSATMPLTMRPSPWIRTAGEPPPMSRRHASSARIASARANTASNIGTVSSRVFWLYREQW